MTSTNTRYWSSIVSVSPAGTENDNNVTHSWGA